MGQSGIRFIRVRGRVVPIRDNNGASGKSRKPRGEGSRVYRDGASKASQRERQKELRAERKSGGRKFQVAGLAVGGLGLWLAKKSVSKIPALSLVAAGAGLVGYGRKKMTDYKKNEYRKKK